MGVQLNLFDLNLLRALDALLHERSVTRAAEKLHVTQQAMSGSLKRLREHFEDDLLVRIGLRLEPTSLGNALLVPVREAMLQIARAVETRPHFIPAETRRQFSVAMSEYVVASFMPLLMARLIGSAPGIIVDIHDVSGTVFSSLESGELDLSVQPSFTQLFDEALPSGIRSIPLFADDFACAVDGSLHSFDELTRELYLSLPHAAIRFHGGDTIVGDAWRRNAITPAVAVTSTSYTNLVLLLPGTPMITTLQRRLIEELSQLAPIRLLECPFPIGPLQQNLFWHERWDDDPAHCYLREQLAAAALDMDAATS